jgi:hypothetical protein
MEKVSVRGITPKQTVKGESVEEEFLLSAAFSINLFSTL